MLQKKNSEDNKHSTEQLRHQETSPLRFKENLFNPKKHENKTPLNQENSQIQQTSQQTSRACARPKTHEQANQQLLGSMNLTTEVFQQAPLSKAQIPRSGLFHRYSCPFGQKSSWDLIVFWVNLSRKKREEKQRHWRFFNENILVWRRKKKI